MKKSTIIMAGLSLITVGFLSLAGATSALAGTGTEGDPFGPGDKVTICHYDGSDTHGGSGKYNQPNPSTTGTGPAGHIGHAFDVIPSYFFQQNQNSPVVFYAGVNWPTLTNLPSSPVDYTPLIGSSASSFIASGCAEPVVSTTTPPPCEENCTTTSPPTTTEPPTTTTPPTTTSPPTTTEPPTTTSPPPTTTSPPPTTPPTNPPGPPNQGPHHHPHHTKPPELAFTGSDLSTENVVGLGAAALALLTAGSWMLWRGFRKEED